jgi:hypothetical protein
MLYGNSLFDVVPTQHTNFSADLASLSRVLMPSSNALGCSRYAVSETGLSYGLPLTLLQTVDDASGFQELQTLQERLDSKIRVRILCNHPSCYSNSVFVHHSQLYKKKNFVQIPIAIELNHSDLGLQFRLYHQLLI